MRIVVQDGEYPGDEQPEPADPHPGRYDLAGTAADCLAEHLAQAQHGGETAWADVTGKPSAFTPDTHSHAKADVGLGNVDNTSDAAKPVSMATQTALDAKAESGHNHDASYAALGHNHAGTYEPANANIQAHVAAAHAPSNAQKNSDITKAEIEAKLTGEIASHTHAGGGLTLAQVYPVGCIYTTTASTNPATVFGFGTWAAFGAGRVLVGLDGGDSDFDAVEETGGAKTHTLQTSEMPSHTHVQDAHNHTQDAHTHTQNSHTHTQDPHTHVQNAHNHNVAPTSATTGAVTVTQAIFAADTSGTVGSGVASANIVAATAVNQNATATNQAATATNQNATATNQAATATNQSTGGGGAHNNVQPYIVVYFFKRTA